LCSMRWVKSPPRSLCPALQLVMSPSHDVSRKHHTWKEQSPWLSSFVNAVGTGVPAKGFLVGADEPTARWNPPRCGVPDLPVFPDGQNGRNRQKRFVLSGGRWDKTDLTYK
uniref:Uncharacterized protein n=1 Tax=Strix occidentalis caurina TaxID=311401 RepID=A0A8D0FDN6_STROC